MRVELWDKCGPTMHASSKEGIIEVCMPHLGLSQIRDAEGKARKHCYTPA